jgi:hypothetical protein
LAANPVKFRRRAWRSFCPFSTLGSSLSFSVPGICRVFTSKLMVAR